MFHSKKPTMSAHDRPMCAQGDSGLVLTTDPKPRLRWSVELHERFVDAVTQLGGPDKATPKTIMKAMGVKGLTLYHLKSHLQKFRLGKQPYKEFNDPSVKDASTLDLQRNAASSSVIMCQRMNENGHTTKALRMQIEVERRLYEQLEVQRHLQLRLEAQGTYMETILDKAYQTLVGENMPSASYKGDGNRGTINMTAMKDFVSPVDFPSLQDHMYGREQLDTQPQMNRSSHGGFLPINSTNCQGKRRPSPYNGISKNPLLWVDDPRLHELGTVAVCLDSQEDAFMGDHLQIAASTIDSGLDMDSMLDAY